jgi:hypothetical protein
MLRFVTKVAVAKQYEIAAGNDRFAAALAGVRQSATLNLLSLKCRPLRIVVIVLILHTPLALITRPTLCNLNFHIILSSLSFTIENAIFLTLLTQFILPTPPTL